MRTTSITAQIHSASMARQMGAATGLPLETVRGFKAHSSVQCRSKNRYGDCSARLGGLAKQFGVRFRCSTVVGSLCRAVESPPTQKVLACGRIGRGELTVGDAPNALDAIAGSDKQSGRGQSHKCQKQRVFDQI